MSIDLRSDTVTRPTPAMLDAMMHAEVGDDVFGEDPSVNRLEKMAAGLFGMEAALYSPTGTMSNQIGIKCHTQPGDEVICERTSHVYVYEGGGIAFNSGSQVRTIEGDLGRIRGAQILEVINPDDVHRARTSLVSLENTANRGGGSCYDWEEVLRIRQVCNEHRLKLHLDGARLFNAMVARGQSAQNYGEVFDSISVCLNKGLGCPIGSILMGPAAFIRQARRIRKVFGGGMRQAGFMAAAGIYALQHHIDRLAIDHAHAKEIGAALERKPWVRAILPVETNIVIFHLDPSMPAKALTQRLKEFDILAIPIAPHSVRFVTHLDITPEMVGRAVAAIEQL